MKKLDNVKSKIKTVWKEHGTEIVVGVSAVTVGIVIGRYGYCKEIRKVVKNLKTFGPDNDGLSIFKNINTALEGSNYAAVPCGGRNQTLADTFTTLYKHFETEGIDLESKITGAVLFVNRE